MNMERKRKSDATTDKVSTVEQKLFDYTYDKLFNTKKTRSLEEALEEALGLKKKNEEETEEITEDEWI